MATYETDEEQVEALKKWWNENGQSLLLTAAAVLLVSFGYQAWQKNITETGEAASALYEDMRAAVVAGAPLPDNQKATAKYLADTLNSDYEDSIYAQFAALQMAKVEIESGDNEKAAENLRWVMEHAGDQSVKAIAALRLGRVLAAMDRKDDALQMLDIEKAGAFAAEYNEARGDIYLMNDEKVEAISAYLAAQALLEFPERNPLLQMKLDDIAVASDLEVVPQVEDPENATENQEG